MPIIKTQILTKNYLGQPDHELKPDVILRRKSLSSNLDLEDKWTEVKIMWELKESPKIIGALLLKSTIVLQDQYAY